MNNFFLKMTISLVRPWSANVPILEKTAGDKLGQTFDRRSEGTVSSPEAEGWVPSTRFGVTG